MSIDLMPHSTPEEMVSYITAAKRLFGEQFVEMAKNGKITDPEGRARATTLIQMGADVNHPGQNGNTALHYTVDCEKGDGLRWLLEQGADPNRGNELGNTSLHWALKGVQNPEAIYTLLSASANPSQQNHEGKTPIDVSMYDGPIEDALFSAAAAYEARLAIEELAKSEKNMAP